MATYDLSLIESNDIVNESKDKNENEEKKDILNFPSQNHETMIKEGYLKRRTFQCRDKEYCVIRYAKKRLEPKNIGSVGLFRSVISRDGNIKAFAPPKGIDSKDFFMRFPFNECLVEEYVEGTMINMFFDEDWEISTRSGVGGNFGFFQTNTGENIMTFRSMFLEACNNANFDFDILNKDLCYSFVLQHPRNRIVTPFTETNIYLIACYKIDNETKRVSVVPLENTIHSFEHTLIRYPQPICCNVNNYDELETMYASSKVDYVNVGAMIYHKSSGARTKIRNPNYEVVRKLRGNSPKDQFRYLILRNERNVMKYLKYYPEDKSSFEVYCKQVNDFTKRVFEHYVECYIQKQKPLLEYPYQFRTHMYMLHQIYLTQLRDNRKHVTKQVTIDYVNSLPPSKLFFSLNYKSDE